MKIIKNNSQPNPNSVRIAAASDFGTTYYAAEIDDIIDAMDDNPDTNIWVRHAIEKSGLEALNLEDSLFGSAVIDDKLYICRTDGKDIQIAGQDVDPEKALSDYSVEELSAYIQPSTPEIITSSITEYEIKFPDINEAASDLLEVGHTFEELMKAATEIELLELLK